MDKDWLIIIVLFINLIVMTRDYFEKKSMQRTIDRLNDRLMARSYTEYVSMQPKPETAQTPRREPLSWYDDADIEEEK